MNIALRILVILILLLNGVALWFANALYGKRNLLIDRNGVLEESIVRLAKTFEAGDVPHVDTSASHEARDVSPVSLNTADITPDTSDFWDTYQEQYEKQDVPRYDITAKAADLHQIYVLDAENKPVLDSRGRPQTEGAPMAVLLAEVQDKAVKQSARINTVRSELTKIRGELEETIADLNAVKKTGRVDKKTIRAREETIAELEAKKAELEGKITELESNITTLEDEKSALQADLDKANEEKEELMVEVDTLKKHLEQLLLTGSNKNNNGGAVVVGNISVGVKGTIKSVDNMLNFAIVEVTPETIIELIGPEENRRPLPEVTFLIRHKGATDNDVIGKIRLRKVVGKENLIVADILNNWKQDNVIKGDEVFYLE